MDIQGRDARVILDAYNSGQLRFCSEDNGLLTGFEDRNRDSVYRRSDRGRIFRYDRVCPDRSQAQLRVYNPQVDVFEPYETAEHIAGERYEVLQPHELLTQILKPHSSVQRYLGMSWRDLGRALVQLVLGALMTGPVNKLGAVVQQGLQPLFNNAEGRQGQRSAHQHDAGALLHRPHAAAAPMPAAHNT
jgi:hypothetical protein